MKKVMGSLGVGMIMGASLASVCMLIPSKKKHNKKIMTPYLNNITNQDNN